MDGVAAGLGIDQLASGPTGLPLVAAAMLQPQQATGCPRRPAAQHGMIDQVQQAGLDISVYPYRDRAGTQSQLAFP